MRALLISLGLAACGAATDEKPQSLRFQPADGTVFIQKLTTHRNQVFSEGGSQAHSSESATRFTVERTEDGYLMRADQMSTELMRDGEPIEDPVTNLLREMSATYEVDHEGKLLGVRGFENISENLRNELPSEMSAMLVPVLTESFLIERGREEWDGRYGDFVGRTFEIGDVWSSSKRVEIVRGVSRTRYSVIWFPEFGPCGAGECLHIRIIQDTDPAALRRALPQAIRPRVILEGAEAAAPADSAASFRSSIEIDRWVEPSTLLPHRESQLRITVRRVQGADQRTAVLTVTETKQYTFEYPSSTPESH